MPKKRLKCDREQLYRDIRETTMTASQKRRLRAIVDLFCEVAQSYQLNPLLLRRIRDFVKHSSYRIGGNAVVYLYALANFFEDARSLLRELADDPSWEVRFSVCASMSRDCPRALAIELLTEFIDDRSARLRRKCADRCIFVGHKAMAPILKRRLRKERDPSVRESLRFAIPLAEGRTLKRGGMTIRRIRGGIEGK